MAPLLHADGEMNGSGGRGGQEERNMHIARLIASPAVAIKIRQKLPDLLQSVNMAHVKLGYHRVISHGLMLLLLPLLIVVFAEMGRMGMDGHALLQLWQKVEYNLVSVMLCTGSLIFAATLYAMSRPRAVYLMDFACYRPHDKYQVTHERYIQCLRAAGTFSPENLEFQRRIVERSGLGQKTYLPTAILSEPPRTTMREARLEAEEVMFNMLDDLFAKTGVKPKDVAILVVNCSLFNPTPSLSSMIVNHYQMRCNIKSINLGGMGCSAGLISIDLAKDLLQVHPNSYAVVVSMENLSLAWYFGNDRSMLVSNCIFRMGGAAILLSNRRRDRRTAKYQLVHTVRTHKGADDRSYHCVYQKEDREGDDVGAGAGAGEIGVSLSRDLMSVAGDALKTNITTLGPLVLPLSEQLRFFVSLVTRKFFNPKAKPYIPDFKLAFEHLCIHAGGRAVLDEMEKNLSLTEWHMEPSRMTLYRFGNTSSSSLWYELSYTEEKGRVTRGHRLWQIAFGSGFKCNSAVWRALRTIPPDSGNSAWSDCIHKFPVDLSRLAAKASQ